MRFLGGIFPIMLRVHCLATEILDLWFLQFLTSLLPQQSLSLRCSVVLQMCHLGVEHSTFQNSLCFMSCGSHNSFCLKRKVNIFYYIILIAYTNFIFYNQFILLQYNNMYVDINAISIHLLTSFSDAGDDLFLVLSFPTHSM